VKAKLWLMLGVFALMSVIGIGCASQQAQRPREHTGYAPPQHYGVDGWYNYHGYYNY